MLGRGLLDGREHEHLDLVELVHAEDAARVLAGGAGLAAKARREPGVAQRQLVDLEDLAGVKRRQRDLGGSDEIELVFGQPVELLLGVGQHAGPVERRLAHEHGRDHRHEAPLAEPVDRPAHERQLEQHEVALQICEARA